jgi:glycosyltransferase involved in cell wall biosynthesis
MSRGGVRVLYLIDSLALGGAERSLAALAPAYRERGVDLTVAYLHERPGVRADLEAAGATVRSLAGGGGLAGAVGRACRLVATGRPDLVHTTLFEADLVGRTAAWLTRVPAVSSLVNAAYGSEQARTPGLRWGKLRTAQAFDAITARRVVRFHAISEYVADAMADRLGVPRACIDVVPRGRDAASLGTRAPGRRDAARTALGLGPGTPMVLAAARHEHQKGLDVLLEAFPAVLERAPAARLVVAGRAGNQTPRLQRTAARLGLRSRVSFLGVRIDVPELLCAADVFVVPSRWEGLGSILLEAMALEAPIVASDLPAVREVVTDEVTGLLVPPDRPDALATAVVTTLADPAAAAARGRRARRRFLERYQIDHVADEMLDFYRRALAGAGGHARAPARR